MSKTLWKINAVLSVTLPIFLALTLFPVTLIFGAIFFLFWISEPNEVIRDTEKFIEDWKEGFKWRWNHE